MMKGAHWRHRPETVILSDAVGQFTSAEGWAGVMAPVQQERVCGWYWNVGRVTPVAEEGDARHRSPWAKTDRQTPVRSLADY